MQKKKIKTWKIVVFGILIFILLVAAICYGAVARYYTTHFFKGTQINGYDCSNLTVKEVKEQITDEIMTYAINIEERNGITERLLASDLGLGDVLRF